MSLQVHPTATCHTRGNDIIGMSQARLLLDRLESPRGPEHDIASEQEIRDFDAWSS